MGGKFKRTDQGEKATRFASPVRKGAATLYELEFVERRLSVSDQHLAAMLDRSVPDIQRIRALIEGPREGEAADHG